MLDGAGARPSTCCGREDCASVFEPCPCNSPVWERSWTTLDLPADLWRSSTSTALGCGQQCCGSRCSAVVLLLFRLAALVFCATIWVVAYSPTTELRLANDLESFTMQNFTLLIMYFLLASGWSAYGITCGESKLTDGHAGTRMPRRCLSRFLMKFTVILFEVCLVNAAFLDLVFWTLLQPIWTVTSLGSIGLVNGTVHGLNFVLVLVDLVLNQLQVVPVHMWFGFFYALAYLFWAMIYFGWRGRWIYEFLDWSKPGWPIFYVGIPVLWVLCFTCWIPTSRSCRHWQNRQQLHGAAHGDSPSLLDDGGRRGSVQNVGRQSNTKTPLLGGEQA